MVTAYLGLGSNIGERISFIADAISEIEKIKDVKIKKLSLVYETEPWGNIRQNDFLNSVIEIETLIDAKNLLLELKSIEKKLGRAGNEKWSEREIDIDLLFYGSEIIVDEFMKVPHQQIENRMFVLIPMNEIAPGYIHPVLNKTISELLENTTDKLKVVKYEASKIENL